MGLKLLFLLCLLMVYCLIHCEAANKKDDNILEINDDNTSLQNNFKQKLKDVNENPRIDDGSPKGSEIKKKKENRNSGKNIKKTSQNREDNRRIKDASEGHSPAEKAKQNIGQKLTNNGKPNNKKMVKGQNGTGKMRNNIQKKINKKHLGKNGKPNNKNNKGQKGAKKIKHDSKNKVSKPNNKNKKGQNEADKIRNIEKKKKIKKTRNENNKQNNEIKNNQIGTKKTKENNENKKDQKGTDRIIHPKQQKKNQTKGKKGGQENERNKEHTKPGMKDKDDKLKNGETGGNKKKEKEGTSDMEHGNNKKNTNIGRVYPRSLTVLTPTCGVTTTVASGQTVVFQSDGLFDKRKCKVNLVGPVGSIFEITCPIFELSDLGCKREKVIFKESALNIKDKYCGAQNGLVHLTFENVLQLNHIRKKIRRNECPTAFYCIVCILEPAVPTTPATSSSASSSSSSMSSSSSSSSISSSASSSSSPISSSSSLKSSSSSLKSSSSSLKSSSSSSKSSSSSLKSSSSSLKSSSSSSKSSSSSLKSSSSSSISSSSSSSSSLSSSSSSTTFVPTTPATSSSASSASPAMSSSSSSSSAMSSSSTSSSRSSFPSSSSSPKSSSSSLKSSSSSLKSSSSSLKSSSSSLKSSSSSLKSSSSSLKSSSSSLKSSSSSSKFSSSSSSLSLSSSSSSLSSSSSSTTCICGDSPVAAATRIVNGQEATAHEYPWMVRLGIIVGSQEYLCGGSIIAKRWILTAAHCVIFTDPSLTQVNVHVGDHSTGATESGSTTLIVPPGNIIVHPNYSSTTDDNDIALLKLPSDLTYSPTVKPVCAASAAQTPASGKSIVTGWGNLGFGDRTPVVKLREVQVDLIDNNACKNYAPFSTKITANMICALTPLKDACQGDSGGPLIVKRTDGCWTQVGVVSFGDNGVCGGLTAPGVYARVSQYIAWINGETAGALANP